MKFKFHIVGTLEVQDPKLLKATIAEMMIDHLKCRSFALRVDEVTE